MADQPAPAAPASQDAAVSSIARSSINNGKGMFGNAPDPVQRTPTSGDMADARLSGDERAKSASDRALAYRNSYDHASRGPSEAKQTSDPIGSEAQKPPPAAAGEQQPASADLEAQVAKFREWEAREQVRAETYKSADDYKVELPADFKAPNGIEFAFKADDPALLQARQWAHSRGLDQETFSEALGLYAGEQVRQAEAIKAAREAEVAKLGSAAPARVDAIANWLVGAVGRQSANALMSMMVTADIVSGFEKIVTKFANGGVISSPGGAMREPQSRGPSDSEWQSMNYNERRAYQQEAAAAAQPRRR